MTEQLPEPRRNSLLRRVDWRFLLGARDRPRARVLASDETAAAVALAFDREESSAGAARVVVIDAPRRGALAAAREALAPGGEVVCRSRVPLPGAARRTRRALERAGFVDPRLYWPGPLPWHQPKFWLPLDCPDAAAHLLAQRPPGSRRQALLRPLWRLALRLGALAPVHALARAPGGDPEETRPPLLLLTGGERSINKVVGLPFDGAGIEPDAVIKFARTPEADAALEHETGVLRAVEAERPSLGGVPRVISDGTRAGRRELVQTALHGRPLFTRLEPATLPGLARQVTEMLIGLAGPAEPLPRERWWERLVGEPLADLGRDFGAVLGDEGLALARRILGDLGDLLSCPEHRDCSPWNVILTPEGGPALLDWESAEPRGLPLLDLVYFLANSVFRMEGAYGPGEARRAYARLLDPATAIGAIAAECIGEYCSRLGLAEAEIPRLRLLCWVVHCRSDRRHLEMEAGGPPSTEALRGAMFLGLVEEELRRAQERS